MTRQRSRLVVLLIRSLASPLVRSLVRGALPVGLLLCAPAVRAGTTKTATARAASRKKPHKHHHAGALSATKATPQGHGKHVHPPRRAVRGAIGWPDAAPEGWNHGEALVGTIRRIPLDGLRSVGRDPAPGPNLERADRRAVVLLPQRLDPDQPVEVLLHLHGYHSGYRQERGFTRADPIRDRDVDRIEAQMEESGRKQLIAVLPQGGFNSDFTAPQKRPGTTAGDKTFDADQLIGEVLDRLDAARILTSRPRVSAVLFTAHSGGGEPLGLMLTSSEQAPEALAAVALFDAINGPRDELPRIQRWLEGRLDDDLNHLRDGDPDQQAEYLKTSLQFRAYHTPGGYYGPLHNDPTVRYADGLMPLQQFLDGWFRDHAEPLGGIAAPAYRALRDHYRVIEVAGAGHDVLLGAGTLRDALRCLPEDASDATATEPAPVQTASAGQQGQGGIPGDNL